MKKRWLRHGLITKVCIWADRQKHFKPIRKRVTSNVELYAIFLWIFSAGKTYVPLKVNISSKNGLYEVQTYNPTIDPFEKKKTNTLSEPTDPFK